MRGRSYTPSPPTGYGRRGRSPSPRCRYGGGRDRDLPTSLLVRNLVMIAEIQGGLVSFNMIRCLLSLAGISFSKVQAKLKLENPRQDLSKLVQGFLLLTLYRILTLKLLNLYSNNTS